MAKTHSKPYSEQVFRANDIRGLAEQELTNDFAYALGAAFAKRVLLQGESNIMICRDARLSSPRLQHSLSEGLQSQNLGVIDLGIGPTPLLGYAVAHSSNEIHSGIMITASHNPADQNGFKIILAGRGFYGDQLKSLYADMHAAAPNSRSYSAPQTLSIDSQYIASLKDDIGDLSGLKVVVDGANGAAGPLAIKALASLGAEVIAQFCDFDGMFPNRSPDTSKPENLKLLQERVLAEGADVGIGFDGDGDRVIAVTQHGRILNADELIGLFSKSTLQSMPGSSVVYDIKCSTSVEQRIREMGGNPVICRSGRSFIQSKMIETNASFAGEFSAHYFFNDRWYGTDDGIYAACRLLQLCRDSNASLEQLCGPVSGKVATGEIYLPVPEQSKFEIVNQLRRQHRFSIGGENPNIIAIDGLRLEYQEGWALVRASNTAAALTLRFEADSRDFMLSLTEKLTEMLSSISPKIDTDGIHHVD